MEIRAFIYSKCSLVHLNKHSNIFDIPNNWWQIQPISDYFNQKNINEFNTSKYLRI